MSTALFNRVSAFINEIGAEKQAAAVGGRSVKRAMDDPGGYDGKSSHPSVKPESEAGERKATEGSQSADNTAEVKKTIPASVDAAPDATPGNAPTQDDVQLGQGVGPAKPTGEDPTNERVTKGNKEDSPTSHPANGSFGEKYSSWTAERVAKASIPELLKAAQEIGTELVADVANGFFSEAPKTAATKTHCPTCHADYSGAKCGCGYSTKLANASTPAQAAAAGYQAAAAAGAAAAPTDNEKRAADLVAAVIKEAHYQADLIADHLLKTAAELRKQAGDDPTGGSTEGEDHDTETPSEGGESKGKGGGESGGEGGGGGAPPAAGGGGGDLMALMGGGGGAPPADPMAGGGAPPADPMAGGGAPPEMAGMNQDAALQQLAMALVELGIPVEALAAAAGGGGGGAAPPPGAPPMGGGGPPPMGDPGLGPKLAAAVDKFKRAGKFRFEEAKTASERKVRDYMKGYVRELVRR